MRRLLLAAALGLVTPLASAAPGDWDASGPDPFDPGVIATNKRILAANPHDGKALSDLVNLYGAHRTVGQLVKEYDAVLAKAPDDWAALVVAGKLAARSDAAKALELYGKAV